MSEFTKFQSAIQKNFNVLKNGELFVTITEPEDRDAMWEFYLDAFPEGTNEIFRERREYDCQCCRQFIRNAASIVAVVEGKLVSLFDYVDTGIEKYDIVSSKMAEYVKARPIANKFLYFESSLGTEKSRVIESDELKIYNHFYLELPEKFVNNQNAGSVLSNARSTKEVLMRGLDEITMDAIEIAIELIEDESGAIYRGEEKLWLIKAFKTIKKQYEETPEELRDNFCWDASTSIDITVSKIRNDVIGTLLVDLSDQDVDLAVACRKYGSKMDGYQEPKSIATKKQRENAKAEIISAGLGDSIARRRAVLDDITINDVLFIDRNIKEREDGVLGMLDDLIDEAPVVPKSLDKLEEVGIEKFMSNILPNAERLEIMMENKHQGNLMCLTAPVNADAKPLFKWHNGFGWDYFGSKADSMRQLVKDAGGHVDGDSNFRICWNENNDNRSDLDAHCLEPNGNLIYYPSKGQVHRSSGKLDVDIQSPGIKTAVENITHFDRNKMPEGIYKYMVHGFSVDRNAKSGFRAELELDGQITEFVYNKPVKSDEKIVVAEVKFSRKDGFKIVKSLPSTTTTKEIWGVKTHQFTDVKMVMNSPNYWESGNQAGNMHRFFILNGCENPEDVKGFHNEYLRGDLKEHRKTFAMIASKMNAPAIAGQLAGLGFSSTQRNDMIVRVTGKSTRMFRVKL